MFDVPAPPVPTYSQYASALQPAFQPNVTVDPDSTVPGGGLVRSAFSGVEQPVVVVLVGVSVGVDVDVVVALGVAVLVDVLVGVSVGVLVTVGVAVPVLVGVLVG